MSKINDGGPAFPGQAYGSDGLPMSEAQSGMSLRDYFAAMAMQAILKNYSVDSHDLCALNAYDMADAMLKAREGGTP